MNCLNEASQSAVASGGYQRLMEHEVGFVKSVLGGSSLGAMRGRFHVIECCSQTSELGLARSFGRQAGGLNLENSPTLNVLREDFAAAGAVQHRGQDVGVEQVPVLGAVDGRSLAVLDGDHAPLLHRADALPRDPAAHVELHREICLAGSLSPDASSPITISEMSTSIIARCRRAI